MDANLPDETTGPEGPLIPSSGCHPAGGFLVRVLPNCYQKCPQSVTKLWQLPHFSGTYVTSIRRKSFRIKRGRRDSNPQPPDRQSEDVAHQGTAAQALAANDSPRLSVGCSTSALPPD